MKVTKAKGLKTDLIGSPDYNPRITPVQLMRSLAAEAMHPRKSVSRIDLLSFVGCCHVSELNRIEPLCLGYFHLGPQMKVTASRAHRRALTQ